MLTISEETLTAPAWASPSIAAISEALAKTQAAISSVTKGNTGKIQGQTQAGKYYEYEYEYAGIDAVVDSYREEAGKNGLATVIRFAPNNFLHIILVHSSGQWIDYGLYPLGEELKTHQKRGSAITYVRRYAYCCIFQITPKGDDDDAIGADRGDGSTPAGIEHTNERVPDNAETFDPFAIPLVAKEKKPTPEVTGNMKATHAKKGESISYVVIRLDGAQEHYPDLIGAGTRLAEIMRAEVGALDRADILEANKHLQPMFSLTRWKQLSDIVNQNLTKAKPDAGK